MRCTVGLVEDDDVIRENYADFLQARGFGVQAFVGRARAAGAFRVNSPDVAVLDVALGEERDGGLLLCSEIRRFSQSLPVIFLTCHDNEVDRISGLRVGGDDYISKDSSLEFLAVRIETLLERRQALLESAAAGERSTEVVVGPLVIDLQKSEVTWRGEAVRLSLTHYWMVLALASARSSEERRRADEGGERQRGPQHHRRTHAGDSGALLRGRPRVQRDPHGAGPRISLGGVRRVADVFTCASRAAQPTRARVALEVVVEGKDRRGCTRLFDQRCFASSSVGPVTCTQ